MTTLEPNKFYRLVDEDGFTNPQISSNSCTNKTIVEFIKSLGNKFSVSYRYGSFYINEGDRYHRDSCYRILDRHEHVFFEEIVDDETPLEQPNAPLEQPDAPITYSKTEIKETLETAFGDEAFFEALKLLPATEAARILSLKFKV